MPTTISYQLTPIPKWYIADLSGKPLGAGYLRTLRNDNHTVNKPVYQNQAGSIPWPTVQIPNQSLGYVGIQFDENGSQGPFYWETDSADPTDLYDIVAYDLNGVFQWEIPAYGPPDNNGGGGTISVASINNLLVNNCFYRNFGASASPIASTAFKIASAAHSGLAQLNSVIGLCQPDIWFYKNNISATDVLSFQTFSTNDLTGDTTPPQFLRYVCTVLGSGEAYKFVYWPITQQVQNLSGVTVSFGVWARCNSGTQTFSVDLLQYFGKQGSPALTVTTHLINVSLSSTWTFYKTNPAVVIPAATGAIGTCGNDAVSLVFNYPQDAVTSIDFVKPYLCLGSTVPDTTFTLNDNTESIICSPRTGHIDSGYSTTPPFGYLLMDDLTIGAPTSAANSNGGLGANLNVFPLYTWLWQNVTQPSGNTLCPVSGGGAVGASADADFSANRTLTLQAMLGRALASAGAGSGLTARTLGAVFGTETNNTVPPHSHEWGSLMVIDGGGGGQSTNSGGPLSLLLTTAQNSDVGTNIAGSAVNNMQPSSFVNFYIKL